MSPRTDTKKLISVRLDKDNIKFAAKFAKLVSHTDNLSLGINSLLQIARQIGTTQLLQLVQNNDYGENSVTNQAEVAKQNNFNGATIHATSLTIADEKPTKARSKAKRA
jgi:hypothetical protein